MPDTVRAIADDPRPDGAYELRSDGQEVGQVLRLVRVDLAA
jgi:hypothetical protein